jgi:HK97 gp10 family phage protein
MKYEFNLKGGKELVKMLHELPAELVSKRGGPVRLALRKAAMAIRDEESRRFQALTSHDPENTGLLDRSIIAKRGRVDPGFKGEKYIVTFKRYVYLKSFLSNVKKLGTGQKMDTVTTRKTAQIFEYGSSHQSPRPFIRPAFNAKAGEAVDIFMSELKRRIDIINKKVAKGRK